MASLWQKALMYLGLVDEDRGDEEPEQAAPTRTRTAVTRPAYFVPISMRSTSIRPLALASPVVCEPP